MKLYVGNLPYSVTEDELTEMFRTYGKIESVNVITDRATGKAKGFAFVEMATRTEGEQAIAGLNGKSIQNRSIVVNEARPQTKKPGGGGRRGPGR
jgi:RNA recognition motif-containing protein